jgi:hypothetical protein
MRNAPLCILSFDADRTIEKFSATLRNEVDLNRLREDLLAVVEETMHPSHVSLWLRPTEQDRTHSQFGLASNLYPESGEKGERVCSGHHTSRSASLDS